MKGLEALRKLSEMGYLNIPTPKPNIKWTDEDNKALGYAFDIQKELKALEIIKKYISMNRAFKNLANKESCNLTLVEIKALIPDEEYKLIERTLFYEED